MKKIINIQPLTMLFLLTMSTYFTACKDPEVNPCKNCDEELITSVILYFEDTITGDTTEFAFRDLDGISGGGAPAEFDTIQLDADTEYHVHVLLLNESVSPAEDITAEVEEEGVDHQFFYTVAPSSLATVEYDDTDINGNPVGINVHVNTGDAGEGIFMVTLKHQPGIKDGNITTGETDVEVNFVLEVE